MLGTRRPLQTDPDFEEIAPQIFRHNFEMNLGIIVPVATFLLQLQQSSWVLVDTGAGTEQHCKSLIKGVKAKLGSADDKLRLILLTHWHGDHTGCLHQVVEAFPDAAVGMHELDAPYIVGGADARALKGDNFGNLALRYMMPLNSTAYPKSKALLLKGSTGDVADLFTYSNWLPRGILSFLHLPGHSPGQVAIVHHPSSSVLTADSIRNIKAVSKHPHLSGPLPGTSLNLSAVEESIKALADIDAQHFFPSHDDATGVTGKQLKMFAMA
eukprot:jgi/Astpho2/8715/Aster-05280